MSTASTEPCAPTTAASRAVVAPVPQPTSITHSPARTSARPINSSVSGANRWSSAAWQLIHVCAGAEFQYSAWAAFAEALGSE